MQTLFNVNTANFLPSKDHEPRLIKVRNLNIAILQKMQKGQDKINLYENKKRLLENRKLYDILSQEIRYFLTRKANMKFFSSTLFVVLCLFFSGCSQWNAGYELGYRNQYFRDRILTKGTQDYKDYLDLQKRAFPALQGYCVDNGDPSIILPLWASQAEFVWEKTNTTVTISSFGVIQVSKRIPQKVSVFRSQQAKSAKSKPVSKQIPSPALSVEKRTVSSGTGFAVSKYAVVTALHVVENKRDIKLCFDGRNWIPAFLEKQSESLDIAIIKVEQELKNYLPLMSEETAYAGDKVFTFGYPVVQLLGSEIKYSEGAISSMTGLKDDQTLIQTTVPIQPGNSGSPLFNENGEVIGMLTSTAALPAFIKATGTIPQNINWAVKAEYISALMKTEHHRGRFVFKNRRELMKATREATCQIMAQ